MKTPRWPFMPNNEPEALAQAALNTVESPEAWTLRCARRLAELVTDECVSLADLQLVAATMAEDPTYNVLEPEAAADLHVRLEA